MTSRRPRRAPEQSLHESPTRRPLAILAPLPAAALVAVEGEGSDRRLLLDGQEVHRGAGPGDAFPKPLCGILNFAKINAAPITVPSWTMEVDWVKHERRR